MKKLLLLFIVFSLLLTLKVTAETVAYWRFENGTSGAQHSGDLDDWYSDSSGNSNSLSTVAAGSRPAYINEVPFVVVPQTDAANTLAMDFDGIIDEVRISNEALPPEKFLGTRAEPGVNADTIAYWRFEEGVAGWANPDYRQDVYFDSSPNNNHLWIYESEYAPEYTADVPFDEVPLTHSTNTLALNFAPNDELYARWKPVNTNSFSSGWTVECMVKFDKNRSQTMVNKDGRPNINSSASIFQLKVNNYFSKFELAFFDGNLVYHSCSSSLGIKTGIWYNIAAVCDGSTAQLYLKEKDDLTYKIIGSINGVSGGALYNQDSFWAVGRGMSIGGISDWVDGSIDEVRLTDSALPPAQFLGSPIPEPGIIIGILALVLFAFRRIRHTNPKSPIILICLILFSALSASAGTNIFWQPLKHVVNGGYPRIAEISDGSLIFGTERGGDELFLVRSYDAGSNWINNTRVTETKPEHNLANSFPLQLQNGNILFAGRNHTPLGEDNWIYRLPVFESTDMGNSWHYYSIIEERPSTYPNSVWEPFLLQLPDGIVQAYYADLTIHGIGMRMSYDNGLTWSNEIEVATMPSAALQGNGMPGVVRLDDGKLICVFESGEMDGLPHDFWIVIRSAYSTDNGYTWSASHPIVYYPRNPVNAKWNASAPNIAKMSDGTLFVSFQTDEDVVYSAGDINRDPAVHGYSGLDHCSFKYVTSIDNGATWSTNPVYLAGSTSNPSLWNTIFISSDDTLYGIKAGADIRIGHEIP